MPLMMALNIPTILEVTETKREFRDPVKATIEERDLPFPELLREEERLPVEDGDRARPRERLMLYGQVV
ncbi:hypothetical protein MchiMG62_16950 [Methanoculleus chikugoensis]|uniref:Uncharacterized protein n=1 Tax=Methanoculleus chikugoensis TaxID=118126 RepID=A0ABM7H6M0_9EURY|nr:hypothetical protein MchiMG62_16950 [Methanoculleus chikugoensis]